MRLIEQVTQVPERLYIISCQSVTCHIVQRAFAAALLSALLLIACGKDSTVHLTSTPTADASSTPISCHPDQVLTKVDALLAGTDYEAHYLTINGQLTLSIWFVDPEIDPEVEMPHLAEHTQIAFLRGATLAHQVVHQIPCTRQVFKNINPMIVDRDYNSWYVDVIPIWALPQGANPAEEDLLSAIERSGMEIAYLRHNPPEPPPPSQLNNTCTWPEARVAIQNLFGDTRRNAAAYLISGYQAGPSSYGYLPQVFAQVQWDVSSPEETSRDVILEKITYITQAVACLSPPLDRMEVYIVDPDGQLLIFGLVRGSVIREDPSSLSTEQIVLRYLQED